jgi:hypothetical protein
VAAAKRCRCTRRRGLLYFRFLGPPASVECEVPGVRLGELDVRRFIRRKPWQKSTEERPEQQSGAERLIGICAGHGACWRIRAAGGEVVTGVHGVLCSNRRRLTCCGPSLVALRIDLAPGDSVQCVEVLLVGIRERVEVLLRCLDLGVSHAVHHALEIRAACEQPGRMGMA